jgi:serine/threonine protein kinase
MMTVDSSSLPKEGDILLGKYRVERVLGAGGMGVVVAAWHVQLDEHVAIKFLLPEAMQSGEAVARFIREARAAVKIKSEHIARVTDVGQLENGAPYMIMEYLEGQDLSAVLLDQGRLPIHEAVGHVIQACEAIAEAHALGIVHRDLKPANLFLARRPDGISSVKVLDFGISKVTPKDGSMTGAGMTRTTSVMGSPLYMSPEQMASTRSVDLRTDIYAIGVILHELMTGGPVFIADTMPQLCALILQEPPPPLRNLRPDAPAELEAIIQRCLAKDPRQRFANVAELVWALMPFAPHGYQVSAERISRLVSSSPMATTSDVQSTLTTGQMQAPPRPGMTATSATGTAAGGPSATASAWSETQAPARSGKGALVAVLAGLGLLGIAAIGAIAFFATRGSTEATAPVSPAAAAAPPVQDRSQEMVELLRATEEKARDAEEKAKRAEQAMSEARARAEAEKAAASTAAPAARPAPAPRTAARASAPKPVQPSIAAKAITPKPLASPSPVRKPAADDLFSDRK